MAKEKVTLKDIVASCPFCDIGDANVRGVIRTKRGDYICGVGQEGCAVLHAYVTAVRAEKTADRCYRAC